MTYNERIAEMAKLTLVMSQAFTVRTDDRRRKRRYRAMVWWAARQADGIIAYRTVQEQLA